MKHPCQQIYQIGANNKIYGETPGVCRIIGQPGKGLLFDKWVKKTFNDWAYLKPGNIISNEALFTFDEKSEILQRKTGRDKLQRFRTYSHIIYDGEWYCLTKADKPAIYDMIISGAELVCLTETGQKHIFFKHRPGMWQLDEIFIKPDIKKLKKIHTGMRELLRSGFSQAEIKTGIYKSNRIMLVGLKNWAKFEKLLRKYRGTRIFEFASFMMFISDEDKQRVQKLYKRGDKKNV